MKTLLIIGDDKLGHAAIAELDSQIPIYLNSSNSSQRIFKLVLKKKLSLNDLFKMAWAEMGRSDTKISSLPHLKSNDDVAELIELQKPDRIICFRAGLIINRRILSMSPQFLNIHYADLPRWGGLAAIARALRAKDYLQNACLHRMAPEIDCGVVLAREPYELNPTLSYRQNEELAFAAGLKLLKKILRDEIRL